MPTYAVVYRKDLLPRRGEDTPDRESKRAVAAGGADLAVILDHLYSLDVGLQTLVWTQDRCTLVTDKAVDEKQLDHLNLVEVVRGDFRGV